MTTKVRLSTRRFIEDVRLAVYGHHKLNKTVDRHIHRRVRPKVQAVVKEHVQFALNNLKTIYNEGVEGAGEDRRSLMIVGPSGQAHRLSVSWAALEESYLERKQDEKAPGDNLFMLYKRRLGASGLFTMPTVSSDSLVTAETKSRKSKRAKKDIRFRIDVDVDTMQIPLDDLVRRPLILGKRAEVPEDYGIDASSGDPESVMVYLETGAIRGGKHPSNQPARAFVRKMALKLHTLMKQEILKIS